MADVQGWKAPANQWQDWVTLIFAIWLFVSPVGSWLRKSR
jgi:hypothetical protein